MIKKKLEYPSGNLRAAFRDDFNGSAIDTDDWDVTIGNGMTVSVASGALTISTGTTSASETIIRSKQAYRLAVSTYIIASLSARRANQEFYFELTSTDGLDGIGWLLSGTTATAGTIFLKNNGVMSQTSVSNINGTGTSAMLEIGAYHDRGVFMSTPLTDLINQRSFSVAANYPSPDKNYYIQIRAKNTGTPSASTDFVIDAVSALNIEESHVTIFSGRGAHLLHNAVPIIGSTRNFIVFYTDSTTPLSAGATFNGTARNLLNPGQSGTFRACATADQAGTLNIQQSRDGSTWRTIATTAVAANTTATLEAPVFMQQLRVQYVNGAIAQGSFELTSCIAT